MKKYRSTILLLLAVLERTAIAFVPSKRWSNSISTATDNTARLAHISEWRDLMFEVPTELQKGNSLTELPVREVCILPFPMTDVLLQGETKELCLYEERFHNLFEKAIEEHAGVVAMGYIAPPNGMLQGMPLCEIESFTKMKGKTGFGNMSILATIRAVGRATLLDVQAPEGDSMADAYMTGWCREVADETPSGDENLIPIHNELADKCESLFESIVELKEKIDLKEKEQQSKALKQGNDGKESGLSEATIRRMKLEEELGIDWEDDDDDDDDYDDDDFDEATDLNSALKRATKIAKSTDTQGYTIVSPTSQAQSQTSIQDLTALSWAYFAREVWGDEADESIILKHRLQALNTEDLSERFTLAIAMLMEQQNVLTKKLEKL